MSLRDVVSDKVKDKEYFFKSLLHASSARKRRILLEHATRGEIVALAEVVANVLAGIPDVTGFDNYMLYVKKRHLFRILGFRGRISWKKRVQAAVELGHVLTLFIGDVLPILL